MKKIAAILGVIFAGLKCFGSPMPLLSHSHVNGTVNPNVTVYIVVGNSVISEFSTEAWAQVPFYQAGTFSNMRVRLEDNSITTASTWTIRINGANGNESVSMAGGVKVSSDLVHTDHVNSGDKVDVILQTGSGGTTLEPIELLFLFTPDTSINYQRMTPTASNSGMQITNGYQPYYSNITGILGQNFYDFHTYHIIRAAGRFQNLGVYVDANTRTDPTTFSVYKNGANTGLTLTVAAGQTGLIENTTNSVNVVVGDTVAYQIGMQNGADANPINFSFMTTEYISTGNSIELAVGTDDKPQGAGQSNEMPYEAALTFGGNEYEVPFLTTGTINNFCMYTAQNDCSTNSTVQVYKNTVVDPNILMTIPASSTGTFCDNTHSLTVVSTDTVSYFGNSPAGTGTLYYSSIMAAFTPIPPGIPPPSTIKGQSKLSGSGTLQ